MNIILFHILQMMFHIIPSKYAKTIKDSFSFPFSFSLCGLLIYFLFFLVVNAAFKIYEFFMVSMTKQNLWS